MNNFGILSFCIFLLMSFYVIRIFCIRLWKIFLKEESYEIFTRPLFYNFDENRIRKYFKEREIKIENIKYKPVGYGWIGSRNQIYLVKYIDKSGKMKSVLVRTGLFAGVYVSEIENQD